MQKEIFFLLYFLRPALLRLLRCALSVLPAVLAPVLPFDFQRNRRSLARSGTRRRFKAKAEALNRFLPFFHVNADIAPRYVGACVIEPLAQDFKVMILFIMPIAKSFP